MTLGIALFVVGAVIFAATVIYYLIDQRRTGILYRKKLPGMPIALAGALIAGSGFLVLYLQKS